MVQLKKFILWVILLSIPLLFATYKKSEITEYETGIYPKAKAKKILSERKLNVNFISIESTFAALESLIGGGGGGGMEIHGNEWHNPKFADSIRVKQFEDSIRVFTDSARNHNNSWHSTKYADSVRLKVHLDSALYFTDTIRFKRDSVRLKVHLDSAAYWYDSCKVKVDTTRFKTDSIVNKVYHDSLRSHTNKFHTIPYADSISVKAHRDSMVGIHGSTASPAAGKIPIANGFAKLDSWVTLGLASLIAQKSIINSNAETQVLISEPIPANFLIAGTSFLIRAKGLLNTYSTPPSLTIRVRVGPVTLIGNIVTSVVLIPGASLTTKPFWIEFLVTIRTIGANGTLIGNGEGAGSIGTAGAFYYLGATTVATVAINTIAAEGNYVELTAQFNTANVQNIVTFDNAVIFLVKR